MGYIHKDWVNPISINATELNRIEKGIKDSHEILSIHSGEISNLQLKQKNTEDELKSMIKDAPSILKTITELQSLVSNNGSILETLKDTSNFATKDQLTNLSNSFLHIKTIKQDGKDIFNKGDINIITPKTDTILNKTSDNAISNKAVVLALEELTSKIIIPTKLSELKEDYHHKLITEDERTLWNTIKDISFTEIDPTVPNWAKQPNKPIYEWNEILNTPTIYTHIANFPDIQDYAKATHNHNNIYALIRHEHDNRYADIIHEHLQYAKDTHDHTKYALLNHTHDFNFEELENRLSLETVKWEEQYKQLEDRISSVSMDYNDLLNLPDLTIYTLQSDFITHKHDDLYAEKTHSHNYDNLYAKINHDHDSYYVKVSGDTMTGNLILSNDVRFQAIDSKGIIRDVLRYTSSDNIILGNPNGVLAANTTFKPTDSSNKDLGTSTALWKDLYLSGYLIQGANKISIAEIETKTHNHDTKYSDINHNHDDNYSEINHNHDTIYSPIGHGHNYDSIYAPIKHTHSDYAELNHSHTEFSTFVDIHTVNNTVTQAINNLIDGAGDAYNTLKEIEAELKDNDSAIASLLTQISTKAEASSLTQLTAQINLKADKSALDTLTDTISNKADQSEIDILSNTKADKSEITIMTSTLNDKIIFRRWT